MMGSGLRTWSSLLLVWAVVVSSAAGIAWNNRNEGCSVCRYTIIHRLFDACFLHLCYQATPPVTKYGPAVMRRSALPADWTMLREARAPKKNVPTDWWRPLGLLFWANAPDRHQSTSN